MTTMISPEVESDQGLQSGLFLTPTAEKIRSLSIAEWGPASAVEMIGCSGHMLRLQEKVEKIAQFNEPVLLVGESGSGKELVAQSLYLLSPRRGRPYVAVNCPQYREGNLTVSELFGHKRGSFTGAIADRRGCFEIADGGVIFLDEIGDLHMSAQVMLLRALASGEFQPLGSEGSRKVNVRVVAATNREPEDLRVGEEFRHDLFFRLQYFQIRVPPLRDRGEDWKMLAERCLRRLNARYSVSKKFSDDSLRLLEQYQWPGNVRELLSLTTTGYAMSDGDRIEPEDFESAMIRPNRSSVQAIDDIYERIMKGDVSFWKLVHEPFLDRELNRLEVRNLLTKVYADSGRSYRGMLKRVGLPETDYQKFMDFLRHHRLKPQL